MVKRTPLYQEHEKLKARFTEFGGWDMPVFYTSIIEEHNAVRQKAGVFDTSHMGEIVISGDDSTAFLNSMVSADMANLEPGKARYTLLLNEKGGIIDDLIVYRRPNDFLLVVNASNSDKDFAWLVKHKKGSVNIMDISSSVCLLALQGPESEKILQPMLKENLSELKYFHFMPASLEGIASDFSLVARTGYTGEDGFELFLSPQAAVTVWEKLIAAGVTPCGLGCRDTLRLEAAMPLHGHEIDDDTTPLEAGLSWAVYWEKDFFGKDALISQKCSGLKRFLAAFMLDSGIPRAHCDIITGNQKAGTVVSGTFSPTLKKGIGTGFVNAKLEPGAKLEILIHGQNKPATVVKKPFYKRQR